MSALTLAQLQEDLAAARASRLKILESQSYSIGGRSNSRALLAEVNATINDLCKQIDNYSRTGPTIKGGTPCG